MDSSFIEVGQKQICKLNEAAVGDTILSSKYPDSNRVLTVLSDGLGSGIKAAVLSNLTATIALKTIENGLPAVRVVETICATLPICSTRKISYATFTIVDITNENQIKIIEYDNPSYLHFRDGRFHTWEKENVQFKSSAPIRNKLSFTNFKLELGDRIIFFSDGVSQSGLGSRKYPLGYGDDVENYIHSLIKEQNDISAQELADKIVFKARFNDGDKPKDDISCVVIYFRKPRKAILVTGPPIKKENDVLLAQKVKDFIGEKIICGGTTANIIAREWNKEVSVTLNDIDFTMPPMGKMDGVNLISEGIITLGKVHDYLDHGIPENCHPKNPAYLIVTSILKRDKIRFLVGTKINDAHQDPNMPVELEIRRNIVKQINRLLIKKYLKETEIIFI